MALSKDKYRIQIVVDKCFFDNIDDIAKKNNTSISKVAAELLKRGYNVLESEKIRRQIFNVTSKKDDRGN